MKPTLLLSTATALVLGLSGIAWAGAPVEVDCNVNGNANWSYEKLVKQAVNRNSNAGIGNGGEIVMSWTLPNGDIGTRCFTGIDEPSLDERNDVDPGKSRAHNANNRKDK